mmetsp:Transcript_23089/g.34489  ORF Transcript_23089/g.34489 Transcript_23089/m.34489 type:complete len:285 (+) Transcript_23089:397-1251(+)
MLAGSSFSNTRDSGAHYGANKTVSCYLRFPLEQSHTDHVPAQLCRMIYLSIVRISQSKTGPPCNHYVTMCNVQSLPQTGSLRAVVVHPDDSSQRLALVHELEGRIDVVEVHIVSHVRINHHLTVHVSIDQSRNLGSTLVSTKRSAFPDAASHQLEGSSGDFLASRSHTNDDTLAPTDVGRLQCGSHDPHISGAIEGVVDAATSHLHQDLLNRLVVVLGVHKLVRTKVAGKSELVGVQVDGNDALGLCHLGTFNDRQADGAKAEDGNGAALLYFRSVLHCTPTSR